MADSKPGVHVLQLKPVSVPKCMIEGEKFLKWEEDCNTVTPVNLKVDPYGYFLYWTDQNEETQFLDIFTIRDTRTGRYAKVPKDPKMRDQLTIGTPQDSLEEKTLTVSYGPDFVNVSFVHFCTTKKDVARLWTDELLKMAYNILGINGSVLSFMRKAYVKLTLQADKAGRIAVKNIVRMFAQQRDDRRRVEKALADIGLPAGKDDVISQTEFQFEQFFQFCKVLSGRMEIQKIHEELSGSKKKLMTVDQFVQFLNRHQRDPRLNEILYPYANPSRARDLISQYEPNKNNAEKGLLSEDGLLRFLLSEDNNIVSSHKYDLSHDMDQSLCHYFINSSHNTYLTGHQFTGKSSVEMYRQTLLGGCRCVELDFWNGKNEDPIIYHGYTLVPEIPAKEVIEAIAESAFKTSEFPVILSFENHCNTKQQAKIAQYCREIFGDMLLDCPLETHPLEPGYALPSPSMLKRKIIIKNKKKVQHPRKTNAKATKSETNAVVQGNGEPPRPRLEKDGSKDSTQDDDDDTVIEAEDAEVGSDSDDDEDESTTSNLSPEEIRQREKAQKDKGTAGKESEAGAEISALVNYVQPIHFHSFELAERRGRSNEMSSFVETQATALLKEHPIEFVNYNKRQLSRIYPRGTRVDSSNFMPQVFWNAGCQLVALNFQTLDLPMQLNLGIFEFNARSGYLLKPQFMRRSDKKFDPFAESMVDGIIAGTVSVQVISGQFLSDRRVSTYVEVDMFGLPADTVRKRFRTKTVINNGINPVYDEEPFIFKKVVLPELACIRIAVSEDSGRQIGHCVLPVTGLCPGYRHIMLRNEGDQPLNMSTLFVNIMVKDYVPDAMSTLAEALVNPIKYQSEQEKRDKQLSVLTGETEDTSDDPGEGLHKSLGMKYSEGSQNKLSLTSTINQIPLGNPSSPRGKSLEEAGIDPEGSLISKRQDSTGKSVFGGSRSSGGVLEDPGTLGPPSSPRVAEPVEETIVAESLDKLMEHQAVRKQRDKLTKKLDELRKDYERDRCKLDKDMGLVTKHKNASTLMKRLSSKNLYKEAAQSKGNLQVYEQQKVVLLRKMKEDERELRKKYHERVFTALEKCITESRDKQMSLLKEQYDAQINGAQKLVHAQTSREFKDLNRKHRDKDELDRAKREKREEIVKKGVAERDRLGKQYVKKKEDLERQYEELKLTFDEERKRQFVKIERDFEASMSVTSPSDLTNP